MPLFEYFCDKCQIKFEQLTSSSDPKPGACPQCGSNSKKLFSTFAVAGKGAEPGCSAGFCGMSPGASCPSGGGGGCCGGGPHHH